MEVQFETHFSSQGLRSFLHSKFHVVHRSTDPNDRRIVCFRKSKKEEIYFPFPLGSFSLVAVFPPMEKPSIRQFLPDPSETTASNNSFIVSDVCFFRHLLSLNKKKLLILFHPASNISSKMRCDQLPAVDHRTDCS